MGERVAGRAGMKGEVGKGKFGAARGRCLFCARLIGTKRARRHSDLQDSRRSVRIGLRRAALA